MNRYEAAGVVADAIAGKNIVVIAPAVRAASHDFHCVLDHLERSYEDPSTVLRRVRRTNGQEELVFAGGGWVKFRSVNTARGVAGADIALVFDAVSEGVLLGLHTAGVELIPTR